ncbi:glycosyltransferase family 61 protein, partial [Acidisphaera rubrifaciens]|uniref:glycosyltransferase family 61 protein n=1 Tax=Acidisphaera rubrifaciens TaxID=50715 RepID=UPI00066276FB
PAAAHPAAGQASSGSGGAPGAASGGTLAGWAVGATVGRIRPPPVLRLEAPGFVVRYPRIVNAALIPPGPLAAMDEAWTRFEFPPAPVTLLEVRDAIVVDDAMVFDRDLRVIAPTATGFDDAAVEAARARIRAAAADGRLNRHAGPSVLCKQLSPFNYGHFLLEMFPRAYLARQVMPQLRLNYVFHRTTPLMLDVAYRSLFQLGIGLDQMTITGPEPQRFDQLFLFDGLSDHGRYLSPLAVASVEGLGLTVAPGTARRLFVRRGGTEQRNLVDQDVVAARFADAGWDVIDPSTMTLVEQITAFRAAAEVVGVGGAAMANIAFCEPGINVTLLQHAHMPDTFYWFIANIKRMDYAEVRCAPAGAQDATTWNGDFVAAEADIAALLGG